jgi:hypothetical protein
MLKYYLDELRLQRVNIVHSLHANPKQQGYPSLGIFQPKCYMRVWFPVRATYPAHCSLHLFTLITVGEKCTLLKSSVYNLYISVTSIIFIISIFLYIFSLDCSTTGKEIPCLYKTQRFIIVFSFSWFNPQPVSYDTSFCIFPSTISSPKCSRHFRFSDESHYFVVTN